MIELAFLLFSSAVSVTFFIASLALMKIGRKLGTRHLAREGSTGMAGLGAAEGAVFALMGLVLAFAISGALLRFDERKQLVLQEANAIANAYDRLDLLDAATATELKAHLKAYAKERVDLYSRPLSFSLLQGAELTSDNQRAEIAEQRKALWEAAIHACPQATNRADCLLVLQSLGAVFDVARLRSGAIERHPPQIIFIMLFGLGLGGSLLAGFGMAASKTASPVHMMTFAAALAFALFVVTDIEFPRLGLVRVDAFDKFLTAVVDQMK